MGDIMSGERDAVLFNSRFGRFSCGKLFSSLRARILVVVTGILFITTGLFLLTGFWQTRSTVQTIQEEHANNILNSVMGTVEAEYQSINFYRTQMLERRKAELRNISDLVVGIVKEYYEDVQAGRRTEEEAQKRVFLRLRRLRYDNGIGYIWINDMGRPLPHLLMHPVLPELEGKILDDPKFTYQGENLFQTFVNVCMRDGEGFVEYLWPKPMSDGVTEEQPKLSFVRLFRPWNWVIGNGVYIDDIERDERLRVEAVLHELRQTFSRTKIGESGYMFVFNGKKEMLIHPYLAEKTAVVTDQMRDMMDKFMSAADHAPGYCDYLWKRPADPSETPVRKRLYVRYFQPLDWYICYSEYMEDIERPAWNLGWRMFGIALGCFALAFLLSLLLSASLSKPLKHLAKAAEAAASPGGEQVEIPIGGSLETRELGQVLSDMLTTLRAKEDKLRESSENLRITLDSIGDAVIVTDTKGKIVRMNPIAEQITAWPMEDALGKILTDGIQLAQEDAGSERTLENPIEKVLASGKALEMRRQAIMIAHDGTRRLIADSCAPILDSDGRLLGVVMVFRDITTQVEMERELHQIQKMESLGQLAGGVAHDFNNMLCGILSATELLKIKMPADDENRRFIQLIIDTSLKAADLTEKLLAFSHKGKILSTPISLHKVIHDSVDLLSRSLDKRIHIDLCLYAQQPMVVGDPTQLQNMLINLGVNAGHAMPEGGVLKIETINTNLSQDDCDACPYDLEPGEYIELCVSDTGVGIEPGIIHRIFEPFFTTKGVGKGTGLGLTAVYGAVKEHRGSIEVSSVPGEGTTFHIRLPLACSEPQEKCTPPCLDHVETGSGCILLADDEVAIRIAAEESLRDMGYDVMLASDGLEALELYEKHGKEIQYVILDMVMPKMSGTECFRAIRKINPHAKVLITSGFTRDSSLTSLKKEGLLGFIKKPYRRSNLSAILKEISGIQT